MSTKEAWDLVGHRMVQVLDRAGAALQQHSAALAWRTSYYSVGDTTFTATLDAYRSGDPRDAEDLIVSVDVRNIGGSCMAEANIIDGTGFVLAAAPGLEFQIDPGGMWLPRMLDYAAVVERFLDDQADTMRDVVV
jgi:hypothetical protein